MPLVNRRRGVLAAAALTVGLVGVVPALTATSAQAAITTAFKFNPGLKLLDDKGANTGGAEPSIDIDTPGNVYVTAPVGVPTGGCPFWVVHPGTFNSQGHPYDYQGRPDLDPIGAGGGDCDVSHGARSTAPPGNNADSVAISSLSLAGLTTNNSQDRGKTFQPVPNVLGGGEYLVDRQWQVADRDLKTYYLTVHDLATANIQVAVSYDGGYQYVPNTPAIDATNLLAAQGNNHFSPTVVDTKTHKLYIAYVAPANEAENIASQAPGADLNEHVVYLAVGDPCKVRACTPGQPIGAITWTDYKIYSAPTGNNLDHIFPLIAIDRGDPSTGANKNVYVSWAADTDNSATNRIQMTHVSVNSPGTSSRPIFLDDGTNHSNMFPWLVAGKKGVVDAAWYSGRLTTPTNTNCPPGATGSKNDANGVNNNCHNSWHVTFAQVTGAAGTSPVVTRSYASGVNHEGSICDQGLNCSLFGGDRSLLDFFDMDLDPSGAANIAYVQDDSQVTYTRQCYGKSATTGLTLSRSCGPLESAPPAGPATVCGDAANHYLATVAKDPSGDAVNPTGLGNNGSTDARQVDFADGATAGNIDVTLTVANLQPQAAVPPPGTTDIFYYVTWMGPDGTQYGVEHDQPDPTHSLFFVGKFDSSNNQLTGATAVDGNYNSGMPGTIVWHVPKNMIGNPTIPVTGTATPGVRDPYSVITVGLGAIGSGLVFVQPADRAPNSGFGADWAVCP